MTDTRMDAPTGPEEDSPVDGGAAGRGGSPTRLRPSDDEGATSRQRLVLVVGLVVSALLAVGLAVGRSQGDDEGGELFTVDDDFERADASSLGEVDGRAWTDVLGSFAIEDGSAVVDEVNEGGPRTLSVTRLSATNGTIEVTADQMVDGWGIAFRYVGPFNYWYLQASEQFGVFNVVKVVAGDPRVVGRTRLTKIADGTTVQIRLADEAMEIRVGGRVVYAGDSTHGLGAMQAGLLATGKASAEASWDRFAFTPDEENPGAKKARVEVSTSTSSTTAGGSTESTTADASSRADATTSTTSTTSTPSP